MKRKAKVLGLVLMFIALSIFGVSYVYAKDNTNTDKVWDVHFNNVKVTEGSVIGETHFNDNNTSISFNAPLNIPGDYYEFSFDVENNSNKDAKIDSVYITELSEEEQRYLDYTVTYSDGKTIYKDDTILKNKNKKIVVRLEYKKDIEASDLPTETKSLNLELNINYVEK